MQGKFTGKVAVSNSKKEGAFNIAARQTGVERGLRPLSQIIPSPREGIKGWGAVCTKPLLGRNPAGTIPELPIRSGRQERLTNWPTVNPERRQA
jgi:hypothetical protein